MKTTIDIPEALYKKAKIRAIESGQTLRELVVASLERELATPSAALPEKPSYWANRTMMPGFARLRAEGAFGLKPGDRSIDEILDEVKADQEA